MILASKSKDNYSITLENGRQFVVLPEDISIVKNWSVEVELEVFTSDSAIPYNYLITNLVTQEKIRAGMPSEQKTVYSTS